MPEELGDHLEAQAAVEEIGAERAPQRVRRHLGEVLAVARARAAAFMGTHVLRHMALRLSRQKNDYAVTSPRYCSALSSAIALMAARTAGHGASSAPARRATKSASSAATPWMGEEWVSFASEQVWEAARIALDDARLPAAPWPHTSASDERKRPVWLPLIRRPVAPILPDMVIDGLDPTANPLYEWAAACSPARELTARSHTESRRRSRVCATEGRPA